MTNTTPTISRAHHTNAAQGSEKNHTLIISVVDRPGAIDRVVGVLRRRRSQLQSLTLGAGTKPETFRVTAQVRDAEVVIDHLIEQIRKIIDVQDVTQVISERAITRELALIQLEASAAERAEIIKAGEQFTARIVDETPGTITLEAVGSAEHIDQLLSGLKAYTIREIARSGSVVIARQAEPAK
jgi:acetolactate synthase-1/3 small subunit